MRSSHETEPRKTRRGGVPVGLLVLRAAGLRAGVPSIIIPSGTDQFAWGRRVYELGVGAKPIPRKQLTAEKLAAAIQSALTKDVRDKAKELGTKIQSENGVAVAAKIVMDCVEKW